MGDEEVVLNDCTAIAESVALFFRGLVGGGGLAGVVVLLDKVIAGSLFL